MKRCPLMLFVVIMCLIATAPVLARENLEWTIDIGRQLAGEDWESDSQETSVVGYALYFLEIGESQVKHLSFDFEVSNENSGLWLAMDQKSKQLWYLDTAFNFRPSLDYDLGNLHRAVTGDSWLLTVCGEPINISVANILLPANSNKLSEDKLEINILPLGFNSELDLIESEITVTNTEHTGTDALVKTTVWVGPLAQEPIAVVAREVTVGRKQERRYFALYLAGSLIPPELIPQDSSFLPVGSITGMEIFVTEKGEMSRSEWDFGISYKQGEFGWSVAGVIPFSTHNHVYGYIQLKPETSSHIGIAAGINGEFSFVAEIGNNFTKEFALNLGIRDELKLGENLELSLAILPLQLKLNSPQSPSLNWRAKAAYHFDGSEVWYQVGNWRNTIRHHLGVALFASRPAGPSFSLAWDKYGGSELTAGLKIRF